MAFTMYQVVSLTLSTNPDHSSDHLNTRVRCCVGDSGNSYEEFCNTPGVIEKLVGRCKSSKLIKKITQ